jgi:hypothetical protein
VVAPIDGYACVPVLTFLLDGNWLAVNTPPKLTCDLLAMTLSLPEGLIEYLVASQTWLLIFLAPLPCC